MLGSRSTFARYLAFQVPGLLVVGLVLSTLVEVDWMSVRLAAWLMGLWVVSELALYPLLKIAYAPGNAQAGGLESLIGRRGTARESLAPEGYVVVGAERWQARTVHPGQSIAPGQTVRVVDIQSLTLLVEADSETMDDAPTEARERVSTS